MRTTIVWAALFLLLARIAGGQDVLVASFNGSNPAQNTPWTPTSFLAPGVSYSGFELGDGAFGQSGDNMFAFNVNGPAGGESTLAEAIAAEQFVGFTLTPTSGTLDLNTMEVAFTIQRETFHAPRRYALLTSVGGFSAGAAVFESPRFDSEDFDARTLRFFLPASGFGSASAVEFRLYAYGATFNHVTDLLGFSITRFAGNVFSLSVGAGAGGSFESDPPPGLHREGTAVSISVAPNAGFRFAGWSGDFAGTGSPLQFVLNGNRSVTASFAAKPAPGMAIGTNLGGIADFTTDYPFVDMFKKAREWRTRNADLSGGFDTELDEFLPLDERGFVTQSPFTPPGQAAQIAHTIIIGFPATGNYTFRWNGTGQFLAGWAGDQELVDAAGPGELTVPVASRDDVFFLQIRSTATPDHLRDFQLLTPGFEATAATQPFHPDYTARLDAFRVFRFMDWGATNGSPLASFDERTRPDSATQAGARGAALEYIVDFANAMGRDPWICIPHQADDDYIRRAARLVRDRLAPGLRVYVEYSNETWNFSGPFTQSFFCEDQGLALGLSTDPFVAGNYFTAMRSAQVWKIFEEEFGAEMESRVEKVLGSFAANPENTRLRAEALNDPAMNPTRIMPDAVAIAPYFGEIYTPETILKNGYPTAEEVVTSLSASELILARDRVRGIAPIADTQGWDLICYEGGQHFVGVFGAENDDTLTNILVAANRDPRMFDRYIEYLDMLRDEGIPLFVHFTYIGIASRFGCFGSLEDQYQATEDAPKFRALLAWIAQNSPQEDVWTLF